ncbi:shikimate kinase [Desulfatitalea alkaliphila]|uniref:Shikimate kinase n=1 Tax=Desulfatitalea alkaliphila TaxID=2929485 RepID=A0AA41QYY2_9BACT|nr:shikimate kinase [Desulfatitalea alkaliphila]MCJ8498952.1 shikimate kinase [Desulfatitalea alkaliphila]
MRPLKRAVMQPRRLHESKDRHDYPGGWLFRRMTATPSNIVLIGMPGSGKSTVGVILAKMTSRDFVDTDVLIQTSHRRTLQDIVDQDGYAALRKIEEQILLGLDVHNHVIATGGSAIYSDASMTYLKTCGILIFLDVDMLALQSRVADFGKRGLAKPADQSFAELFQERVPLYRKYADIRIECAGLSQEGVCMKIMEKTGSQPRFPTIP